MYMTHTRKYRLQPSVCTSKDQGNIVSKQQLNRYKTKLDATAFY